MLYYGVRIRYENGNPLKKKEGEETFVRFFRCSGRIFFGSDPITRHTGAKAAKTYHRALLIHALGPLRALEVDPD